MNRPKINKKKVNMKMIPLVKIKMNCKIVRKERIMKNMKNMKNIKNMKNMKNQRYKKNNNINNMKYEHELLNLFGQIFIDRSLFFLHILKQR